MQFTAGHTHSKYLDALTKRLQKFGNGDAVIKLQINKVDGNFVFSDEDGFMDAVIIDTDKITDMTEESVLSELVANTTIKMDQTELERAMHAMRGEISDKKNKNTTAKEIEHKVQADYEKMKSGIKKSKKHQPRPRQA